MKSERVSLRCLAYLSTIRSNSSDSAIDTLTFNSIDPYRFPTRLLHVSIFRRDAFWRSCVPEASAGNGNFASELSGGLNPLFDDCLRVGDGLAIRGAICHATGQLRHLHHE